MKTLNFHKPAKVNFIGVVTKRTDVMYSSRTVQFFEGQVVGILDVQNGTKDVMIKAPNDVGFYILPKGSVRKVKVGDGATICLWSDRHAATIVSMTAQSVTVQRDKATRTDKNGMSESQTYTYEPDPNATRETFRLSRRTGLRLKGNGATLSVGGRSEYHDYSF